ncbi:class I SAM-dependent methyltransferase [Embleya sp. AB8]|uniref:class I SAM-dependent methyltransferase n=1 Tax=Embleya sp. AB8 TaxID=3156304 RepID=UPI003C745381
MTNSAAITAYWDAAAVDFDDEPDHGLRAAETRAAWAGLLAGWLPSGPADVLDVGCGTGSLAELMAQAGHRVTGVDLAPLMIERARAKLAAAGLDGRFLVGDAAVPPTGEARFDVVLSRHLVWTLPDPRAALGTWVDRIRPGGVLVLVEGRWSAAGSDEAAYVAGADTLPWHRGIGAADLADAVRPLVREVRVESLTADAALWGGPVTDERYVLIARI